MWPFIMKTFYFLEANRKEKIKTYLTKIFTRYSIVVTVGNDAIVANVLRANSPHFSVGDSLQELDEQPRG